MVYKNILMAVDLHPSCDELTAQHAADIAKLFNAQLYIIHAVEHLNAYGVAQAYPTVIDLEEDMVKEAQKELTRWGSKLDIPPQRQFVEVGSPKIVILNKAEDIKADLIVVGSHGRHGIGLLLGSTANGVLHNAKCDVLAVRVKENH